MDMKSSKKKWILLLISLMAVGALLIFALTQLADENGKIDFGGAIRAEMAYLVTAFLIVIPILLILFVVILLFGKKESEVDVIDLSEAGVSSPSDESKEDDGDEVTERFCMLSEIDRKANGYGHRSYEKNVSLRQICEEFRHYAAYQLKLYYDIDDIRRFVAGLGVSKLLILQGMSGTGKTSLAHAFGSYTDNSSTVVPVSRCGRSVPT